LSHIPGGHVLSIPTLITVPATTGAKSEETIPELLLTVPLDGVAASALLLGSNMSAAAIRLPSRTHVESLDRLAIGLQGQRIKKSAEEGFHFAGNRQPCDSSIPRGAESGRRL
jgi:hypothetical protein